MSVGPEKASALIVGGASGLGAAAARRLRSEGLEVTVADLDVERGAPAAEALGARFVTVDVTDAASVEAAARAASDQAPLRVCVCSAGIAISERLRGRAGAHNPESFSRTVAVNLNGSFNVLRAATQVMADNDPDARQERGVVVLTASIAAFDGQIGQVAYAASKGGVAAMTLPAARDLASAGVRVCTIAPGTFETPMLAGLPDAARDSLAQAVPFPPRLGRPHEYADLVWTIVTNQMLNGEVIRLDGAMRMPPR